MEQKVPKSPTYEKVVDEKGESTSPRRSGNKWQRMFSLHKFPSMPASPSSPASPDRFFHSPSYESILKQNQQTPMKKKEKQEKKDDKSENTLECGKFIKMTSPAINGQKESGKSESTSAALTMEESSSRPQEPTLEPVRSNSPLTAWWRVFKLANLLMQQGC